MGTVHCRECGRQLEQVEGLDSKERRPCPTCGSTARNFTLEAAVREYELVPRVAELSVTRNLVEHWRRQRNIASAAGFASGSATVSGISSTAELFPPSLTQELPDVLLAAEVVTLGGRTPDGRLVVGVTVPWFEIIRQLEMDSGFLFKIHWRKLEEMIAGAFERDGWPEVILTPPSGDKGRDVIATRPGVGSVRIIGQVKAYHAGHVVDAEEVKAVAFTRELERASKAMLMTTGRFAPGALSDPRLQAYVPHQLELLDGPALRDWLLQLQRKK